MQNNTVNNLLINCDYFIYYIVKLNDNYNQNYKNITYEY